MRIGEIYDYWNDTSSPHRCFKGGGKRPVIPAPPPPAPTPTDIDEDVRQKDIERRRQKLRRTGRAGTILTEQTFSEGGQATLLGRSTS